AGIPVTSIGGIADESGQVYSSSLIRRALRQGEIAEANKMLGWEWEVRGEVVKGDQRGRELGFPTANFALGETIHPAYGVYAARVNIEGEKEWSGAAVNIGIRPMFEIPEAEVESYIFDFNREIYGKTLRVQPVQRLRSEAKFNSVDELKAQMKDDCERVRKVLKI
ncbi:MAG: riboflavin kinase, partial [Nitrosomonas ureae]